MDERADLLERAITVDPGAASELERLRAGEDPRLVALAIELVAARRRAAVKFPDRPDLVGDVTGVEQASSAAVARHKAQRFAGADGVLDLCCGIGGDLMGLAAVADAEGVDLDPVRAWMAGRNASAPTRVADVLAVDAGDRLVHLDPSRRGADGRRHHRYEEYAPGPAFIEQTLDCARGAAVKLGPGVEIERLPLAGRELEVINEGGTLVQAVLYAGVLARGPDQRTATRLPDGETFSALPAPLPAPRPLDRRLLVPDPALERAGLVGARVAGLDIGELHPGLGLLTTDAPIDDPWFDAFTVLDAMPWRERRVRDALRGLGAGVLTVRTRGGAVDVDRAQRDLRGDGDLPLTLFGLRLGQKKIAVITQPA